MSKFKFTILKGVAAVYANGQNGEAVVARAGATIDCELAPRPQPKATDGREAAKAAMQTDVVAPAAGVATDEPVGKRSGLMQIAVTEGAVKVRVYVGADYTERAVAAGEKIEVPVTESNRITLAVYPA